MTEAGIGTGDPPGDPPRASAVPGRSGALRRAPRGERVLAGLVAMAILAVLALAAGLDPDPRGVGTHEQIRLRSGIGLTRCSWLAAFGRPCPTCGMTTAFAHAADLNFSASFRAQPLGAVLALAMSALFWIALHVAATGSTLADALARRLGRTVLWSSLAGGLAAWAYKIWAMAH